VRTIANGVVTEKYAASLVGKSRDGKLEVKVVLRAEDASAITAFVPMIEGTKREFNLKKTNQTLDEFKTAGPLTPESDSSELSETQQAAYDARLKKALDIQRPEDPVPNINTME